MGIENFIPKSPEDEARSKNIEEERNRFNPELASKATPSKEYNENMPEIRKRVNFYRELNRLKRATNSEEKDSEQAHNDKMHRLIIMRNSIIQTYNDTFPGLADRLGTTNKAEWLSTSELEMGVNDVLDEINDTWYRNISEEDRQELAEGEIRK